MADPILPDFFRALVIFHHESGIPENVFVNSWCFRNDGAIGTSAVADNVASVLDGFYQTSHEANPTIMSYIAGSVESVEYRVYDLGQTPPRIPEIRAPADPWVGATGQAFPFEVSVCLSMVAERNLPRSRGRLYLGPLAQQASQTVNGQLRPSSTFRTMVSLGAQNVLNTTENVSWHILSQADAQAKMVTGGWVDDAWDTVRKRGLQASDRVVWGAYTS